MFVQIQSRRPMLRSNRLGLEVVPTGEPGARCSQSEFVNSLLQPDDENLPNVARRVAGDQ